MVSPETIIPLRICIVSEALQAPFDEGVKLFAYNLTKELSKVHTVLGLGRTNNFTEDIEPFCLKAVPQNKLFLSFRLKKRIRSFNPDVILYFPTAHATVNSFIRTRVLKHYGKRADTVLVTLQPRKYSAISKKVMGYLVPDLVLAQSGDTYATMKNIGCRTEIITCGVDLEKFTPAGNLMREELRKKYGMPNGEYIVLHVGHINRNRNAQIMGEFQALDGIQSVVVGSTSYPEDKELVQALRQKGVIVITGYVERIQEIYQLADCYIFPVRNDGACIEIPLSILEALACDIPVVTTRFRGLPEFIPEQPGFYYVDDVEEIEEKINTLRKMTSPGTRAIALQHSWESVAKQIVTISRAM